jgi:hypothetical protein
MLLLITLETTAMSMTFSIFIGKLIKTKNRSVLKRLKIILSFKISMTGMAKTVNWIML